MSRTLPADRDAEDPPDGIVRLSGVVKHFHIKKGMLGKPHTVHAVDGVDLSISQGETLGVVGESGCGKSTLARVIVGLHPPTAGTIQVEGADINAAGADAQKARRKLQMVFQDPAGSLNPRLTIRDSVAEPLRAMGVKNVDDRVHEILDLIALKPEFADRLPHQLSGGQQQRACIARALIAEARIVVHDESVSALDVSLQAQVLNLLRDLQERLNLTYVFISHDLATVQSVATRIAVMYLGKIVEIAPAKEFHARPLHPYSIALRSAVPVPDPRVEKTRERIILHGSVPSPLNPPPACRFHSRCPAVQKICREVEPSLVEHRPGHWAACHFAGNLDAELRPLAAALEDTKGLGQ